MKIVATIITFHPDPNQLQALIHRVGGQVSEVIVVDNSPNPTALGSPTACYHLPQNPGLAFAQNLAINKARQTGATHILMLDQDSLPMDEMVTRLREVFEQSNEAIAAVGAAYENQYNGQMSYFMTLGYLRNSRHCANEIDNETLAPPSKVECDFLISSGTLFSVDAISHIGSMDESLFIDYIDTDWMLRAKATGYKVYGAPAARMRHALGEGSRNIWFGRWRNVPVHAAFRYYYIFRNSLLVQRKQYATTIWRWFELKRMIAMLGFLIFSKDRIEKLKFASWGLRDGLKGKSGPLESLQRP